MNLSARVATATIDAFPANVAILDADGIILASNEAWREFGHFNGLTEPVDSIGVDYLATCADAEDDPFAQSAYDGLSAVVDGERETFTLEYPCHSPDRKRWFRMDAGRFTVGDDTYAIVAHVDITERRVAEEAVRRRNEELEELTRLLAHDLKNPLNVAIGYTDLAAEDPTPERLEKVRDALDRSVEIIEEGLEFLRVGFEPEDATDVSVESLARQAWANLDPGSASLVIETDRVVHGDPTLLSHVFENLLKNALDHGGPDVTVTVAAFDHGFFVADDGPGIPEDTRDRLFEIGYTTNPDGTGFGLPIVRTVVEAHGWTIDVTESEAGGARFEIRTGE